MDHIRDLPFYSEYSSGIDFCLLQPLGQDHYRLLSYLSTLFKGQYIFDIGTHVGNSAYALAYNEKNIVHTFDIVNNVTNKRIMCRENIEFHLCNLFDATSRHPWLELLLGAPMIFLDVDPHNGLMEMAFYQFLVENKYNGLLICDDIWYFKEMRDHFWSQIPTQLKYDLTA